MAPSSLWTGCPGCPDDNPRIRCGFMHGRLGERRSGASSTQATLLPEAEFASQHAVQCQLKQSKVTFPTAGGEGRGISRAPGETNPAHLKVQFRSRRPAACTAARLESPSQFGGGYLPFVAENLGQNRQPGPLAPSCGSECNSATDSNQSTQYRTAAAARAVVSLLVFKKGCEKQHQTPPKTQMFCYFTFKSANGCIQVP